MSVELVKLAPKSDPLKTVETLLELVDRARTGELESFIAVCMRSDGTFWTRSSGYKNSLELIGALECAKHDLVIASEK